MSFAGGRGLLSVTLAIRSVLVPPACSLVYDEIEWRDALVLVECGEIMLEARDGGSWRFQRGNLLWLQGLPLVALRNPGAETAVLIAASRTEHVR